MIVRMKNKYIVRLRISEAEFREISRYFCLDIKAVKISEITKIFRKTINKILKQIRISMMQECEKISKVSGEIKIDESYFKLKE